jgi:thioesterase domain-containing protein
MIDLDALADRVRAAIPLTTHLDFRFTAFDGERLTLTAPLAPNHNDKGTFFAGSQAALLTLAGWACTTLMAESVAANAAVGEGAASVDVVAVESSLQFRAPLHGDIEIRARADDGESGRFHQRLKRRGKASLAILAQATDAEGVVVCEYQGLYLARTNTDNA